MLYLFNFWWILSYFIVLIIEYQRYFFCFYIINMILKDYFRILLLNYISTIADGKTDILSSDFYAPLDFWHAVAYKLCHSYSRWKGSSNLDLNHIEIWSGLLILRPIVFVLKIVFLIHLFTKTRSWNDFMFIIVVLTGIYNREIV